MPFFGRRRIYTDETLLTAENAGKILRAAIPVHAENRAEIDALYDIYRGKQRILSREKAVRPEINNQIVVNHANEIVAFKTSYLLGEPLQYVSRGTEAGLADRIDRLNDYMHAQDKARKDKDLAEWMNICGVAYRLVLPNKGAREPDSPFKVITLDPRDAFVVYNSSVEHHPVCGVVVVHRLEAPDLYCVYSEALYLEVEEGLLVPEAISKQEKLALPAVPLVEYDNNNARMGAFEPVLSLLDEINNVESNRVDGIEQTIQSLLVFENCDVDEEGYAELRASGAMKIKSTPGATSKVYPVNNELPQDATQQVVDDLYNRVLSICGMPSQQNSGDSSTSDTGAATIMRNGWYTAEARAKDSEDSFKSSEMQFLRVVLEICEVDRGLTLALGQIDQKFTRRNYADLLTKVQSLVTMLGSNKVHPKLAFQACGLFTDSEQAYLDSMGWYKEQQAAEEERAQEEMETKPTPGDRAAQPGEEAPVKE